MVSKWRREVADDVSKRRSRISRRIAQRAVDRQSDRFRAEDLVESFLAKSARRHTSGLPSQVCAKCLWTTRSVADWKGGTPSSSSYGSHTQTMRVLMEKR